MDILQLSGLRPDARDRLGSDEWLEAFHLHDVFHAERSLDSIVSLLQYHAEWGSRSPLP
jgi:hypothetical protein